ncbi:tRNA 2-selenouridine(34) synthase MnmH [Clostridium sp. D53t1_180928_C8]|uniref:tRNA 2-selenouridine(34) synthase MnmH n=1 Tax=Clostridium sp. D53t1_180928_C8 TaxID=2787101 RepID=UPI0018A9B271|nr:tRNA 2-selenouridine(34) synthase MnmH [Clostridium sp. D53t1_180928_C8]
MKDFKITNDYKNIIINELPLLDVRAAIEFEKGAFINSTNIPILTNDERHIIGVCYKEKGNIEATKLGYSIVSGENKRKKLAKWREYLINNPTAIIYCFRGGSRSTIAQGWIENELGISVTKLDGGYKNFRNYLINSLNPSNISAKPIVLTGYTGSGKTEVLREIDTSIDLEGIANHRGSAFGGFLTPQPTQINFENNLAYEVIKHSNKRYNHIIVEDESKNIGKSFIPTEFYKFIHQGNVVFLDSTLEERIENILNDYVIKAQTEYIKFYDNVDLGMKKWYENIEGSMMKLKERLGGDRFKVVLEELKIAFNIQCSTNDFYQHIRWIELFLVNYYDPLYKHSISKDTRNIIYKGDKKSVLEFLKALN